MVTLFESLSNRGAGEAVRERGREDKQGNTSDTIDQQLSAAEPQASLKLAIPDCLVRGTDLFSLRLSN